MRWDRAAARRRGGNRRGSKVSAAQTRDTMSTRCGASSERLHSCMDSTADDKSAVTLPFTFYRKYMIKATWSKLQELGPIT